ncbi:hypothetical protein ZWY2020_035615 [Hordeum vulgare]|nr:hypothetical protein ZWY2020_035615 [Hordeum vulgare]
MRIMIKGGVWKNTEDEILKAAVMKYGKNQWARISSLLVRKSAKQCKARWYEWLDPSIKKTEWTREEDEKLLQLAKLMPTQWRTIAPILGRPPSQGLERDEKLPDAACAKDENYEPNDDPRKLRPGEIDPNPESKPAPSRLYDTVGEDRPLEHVQFPTTIEELEGRRRTLQEQDSAEAGCPCIIMQTNKLNDPEAVTRRSKLMLPPPQISDIELERLLRWAMPDPALAEELSEGSTATRTLLANYSQTPRLDGNSFGLTPKATPFRDELHINEEVEMQDSAQLELRRQAELRKGLRSGFASIPQPKNEYQIVMPPITEENEESEEKIEEDMSDRLARERAEEQARQEALLRKRSKVLQRSLPRPPAASVEILRQSLIKGGESRSTFVPPTSLEQADELINEELLRLLEHDNAKYPLDEPTQKEKKKGSKRQANGASFVPEIEGFDEHELKESHDACQEDLMYFPTNNSYGLASVAGNADKISALQHEFEMVKKRMDVKQRKLLGEQKIKLLTQGYQRAAKLGSQIQDTFKQMNTAATEHECFQELQKQEQMASAYRERNLAEEVNKQKALERTLQSRYGDLLSGYQSIQEQRGAQEAT